MIDQDSTEFAEAFIAAVRPNGPRGKPAGWMAIIAIGVLLAVALASLLNGAIGGGGSVAAAPALTAVAGPGCTSDGTRFTTAGYYAGSAREAADWTTSRTGGYVGEGCTGGFVSLPLSGHATAYDSNRYVLWTFHLSSALDTSASCRIYTYVPDVTSLSTVGGVPAVYYYYGTAYSPTAKPLGTYVVNQVEDRGQWVPDSSLPVSGGQVSVKMVDAGATPDARAAAAQVGLMCSAA